MSSPLDQLDRALRAVERGAASIALLLWRYRTVGQRCAVTLLVVTKQGGRERSSGAMRVPSYPRAAENIRVCPGQAFQGSGSPPFISRSLLAFS